MSTPDEDMILIQTPLGSEKVEFSIVILFEVSIDVRDPVTLEVIFIPLTVIYAEFVMERFSRVGELPTQLP
jgi:hypothetical protein